MIQSVSIDLSDYPQAGRKTVVKDGVTYELTGYCSQCGECCMGQGVPHPKENSDHCAMLKRNGDKFECEIYWNRPMGCFLFPFQPDDKLPEHCTFVWEKISG